MAGSAWSIRVGVDLDTSDIQSQLNNATQNTKIKLDTGGAQGDLDRLNNSFDITYQMANKIYQMSKEAIGAMVEEVYTVDKALTEFKKVSDLRGSGLDEYVKNLGESGQLVARTTSDMIDAATMFRKSGFSDAEAAELATIASMYQNIADTEVSASAAASSIVSQIQAWGRGAIEPIHIIDAYNEVANNFAVGTNDLSQALEISASGMATYGNTFEETIGLVTAGTEIMVGRSSQVARGLNTIAANIVKHKDLLEEYGIEVEDSNGNLKSTYDVLRELKPQWDKMTDAERNAVGVTLAGKNQYRVLASIMQNFGHAVDATNTALRSSGSAMEENAAYMESLEARTTKIQALFQQLSQTVVDSSLVKGILDIAAGLLQIANTDIGSVVTQFILLGGALTGIVGMVIKGFGITSITLGGLLPTIALVTGAFIGVLTIIGQIQEAVQNQIKTTMFEDVSLEAQESKKKLEEYQKKIEESKKKLEELQSTEWPSSRREEIDAEIARLEALIHTYERLYGIEKENLNTDTLEGLRTSQIYSGYETSFYKTEKGPLGIGDKIVYTKDSFTPEQLEALETQYANVEIAAYKYADALDINIEETDTLNDVIQKLADNGVHLIKTTHSFTDEINEQTPLLKDAINNIRNRVDVSEEEITVTEDLIKKNKEYYEALKSFDYESLSQEEKNFIRQYEILSKTLNEAKIGAETLDKALVAARLAQVGGASSLEAYINALKGIEGINIGNLPQILDYLKEIGIIDFDYTQSELQSLLDNIDGIDESSADIDVNVDSEEAEATFEDILSAQERLEAQGISIKSTADAQDLLSSLELIEKKISAMSESSINIEVKGNVSKALSDFNSISSVIDSLPDSKNVSVSVKTSGVSELSNISSLLSGLKDKTVNVKVNVSQNGSFPFKADGDDNFEGGPVLINDGKPVNGSSAELVVSNNKAHIYNNGEPTVVNLPKGSKIFNAKDTQNILNSNKDLEFPAFQNGNASYENDGYKDLFDKWLEGKKYLLALNLITEEKYYKDLEDMNEKYLSNIEEAQADYWKHQEEIYKWKTSQIDSQNDALKEQLELEKSLKSVIGAHSNKVLVYKNGTFQYISDIDAIDSAKRSFYKLNDEAKEKSQYSINLGGSGAKVTDNTILKNDYQEIKKMLQDVKYDDLNAVEWGKKESIKQENYTFSIDNLSLPNAKDAAGILSGLKNYAYQYSYG